jgi:hypothetical protein
MRRNDMGKKRRRQTSRQPASRSARFRITPSIVFIAIIVVIIAVGALTSVLSGGVPSCPPGQVWSSAHNHCH